MVAHPLGANFPAVSFNAAIVALASMLLDSLSRLPDSAYLWDELVDAMNGEPKTLLAPMLFLPRLCR